MKDKWDKKITTHIWVRSIGTVGRDIETDISGLLREKQLFCVFTWVLISSDVRESKNPESRESRPRINPETESRVETESRDRESRPRD